MLERRLRELQRRQLKEVLGAHTRPWLRRHDGGLGPRQEMSVRNRTKRCPTLGNPAFIRLWKPAATRATHHQPHFLHRATSNDSPRAFSAELSELCMAASNRERGQWAVIAIPSIGGYGWTELPRKSPHSHARLQPTVNDGQYLLPTVAGPLFGWQPRRSWPASRRSAPLANVREILLDCLHLVHTVVWKAENAALFRASC